MRPIRLSKAMKLATLTAALLATPAFADEASDAKAELATLKQQLSQLIRQVEQLTAKQEAASAKTEKIEAQVAATAPATVSFPSGGPGARGVTARIGGVDVRLFGSFDEYFEHQITGAGTVNRLASSGSGYTQLGFDANKDIGNGYKVFGDVRLSYQTDNGKANSTVRTFNTAAVGFTKDTLGTLQGGRMGTQVGEALSTFRLIRLGTGNFIYNPFTTLTHDNLVKYTSPEFGHVRASVNVDFGENAGTQRKGSGAAGMVKYDDGVNVGLAGAFTSYAPTDISTANDRVKIYTIGGSHDFGFMKPFAVLQVAKSSVSPQTVNQNGWYLGTDIPLGPGTLRLESELIKNKAWTQSNAKSANVRYDWLLSPGAIIYFTYTKIWDDANVYYPIVGTGGFAAVAQNNKNPLNPSFNTTLNGKDPSGLGIGVKFDF
jgi:predicted porin